MYPCTFFTNQGDTVENVSEELECIMNTGHFKLIIASHRTLENLQMDTDINSSCKVLLYYEPIKELFDRKFKRTRGVSESSGTTDNSLVTSPPHYQKQASCSPEIWNREQIDDFVRKLGFLETQKVDQPENLILEAQKSEQRVKTFQQLNQVTMYEILLLLDIMF